MTTRPHNVSDLYLAPLALYLDTELERLCECSEQEIALEIALSTDREPISIEDRRTMLLTMLTGFQDLHGWDLEWTPRGLRLTNLGRSLVLGVPAVVHAYLEI